MLEEYREKPSQYIDWNRGGYGYLYRSWRSVCIYFKVKHFVIIMILFVDFRQ